jgi:hypothetical protein
MLQLHNTSPFVPAIFGLPDQRGLDTLIVVVKATFELGPMPRLAAEQRPIVLADEHWGDPSTSSLRYPSEVHLAKPGTDVIVIGHARAPRERPVTELDVAVQVGDRSKRARVHGDRFWTEGFGVVQPSRAQPFVRMPILYERAYGGAHGSESEPRNPVGVGFVGTRSSDEMLGQPVPNLDDPQRPLTRLGQTPPPIGFAAIAPSWQPRLARAGTYDARWRSNRAPYLPDDFDARFSCSAAEGLSFEQPLRGGEPLGLWGFHPERAWQFAMPCCRLEIAAIVAGTSQRLVPALETVLLETDEARMTMTWRASASVDGQLLRVERVAVGLAELDGVAGGIG